MNSISKRKIAARSRSLPLKKASGAELSTLPLPSPSELDKTFPFLKLPPELREMIYEYLLVPANVIVNHTMGHKNSHGPPKIFTSVNNTLHYRRRGKPAFGEHQIAILCVSRLIYKEALPILYGRNNFIFTTSHVVRPFLAKLHGKTFKSPQPGAERIRHVTLSGVGRRDLVPAVRSLRKLTKLISLTFEVFHGDNTDAMAAAAFTFIDQAGSAEQRQAQFDMISFVCNEEPTVLLFGRPLFTELGPAKCKAKLAELANLPYHD
ncbi:hypothetical protein PRZ48_010214 [Zasmidium cellare]|uniref:DUF7730 domain-containing protein n=1 Tax=Zasmidium cellare TaxID=395010 RepID=A0ABR0EDW8_ZASCE|nr:hypothetical protein PRZ48_010214 [Zasmidium cellare]